eukprot:7276588-Alexandrium_andersonii.AAC.1
MDSSEDDEGMTSAQAVAAAKQPGGLAGRQSQAPKANSSAQAVFNAKQATGNILSNVSPGYPDVYTKGVNKGQ